MLARMAKSADDPNAFVSRISLTGRSGGRVRTLRGFKKAIHTEPDAVTPATSAFLARLCEAELAAEGEALFARARTALGYKRKEVALEVASPAAVLTAKDFTLELAYALEPGDPAAYAITRTLHSLSGSGRGGSAEFDSLFAGMFSTVVLTLTKGVRVDAVIDAVESLEDTAGLTVDYPSDCRHCVLSVEGVSAQVVCDGATLEMRFPHPGTPRELIEAFAAVRHAFALTKARGLAGLQ
jgi:hypothetical protein